MNLGKYLNVLFEMGRRETPKSVRVSRSRGHQGFFFGLVVGVFVLVGFPTLAANSLKGQWSTGCIGKSTDAHRVMLDFTDAKMSVAALGYEDATCTGRLKFRHDTTYYYQTDKFGNIDFTIDSIAETYFSQRDVDIGNQFGWCDRRDWEVGVAMNVTGAVNPPMCSLGRGTRRYSIYKVSGRTLKIGGFTWSFGVIGGSSPNERPLSTDAPSFFTDFES